jgi:hypothetical protein
MTEQRAESSPVTWFEALNQQTGWTELSSLNSWLAKVFGSDVEPGQDCQDRFTATLGRMRLQLGHFHFSDSIDLAWLNEELTTCRPVLQLHQNRSVNGSRLPTFRISAAGLDKKASTASPKQDDDDLLEALRLTFLLQFAQFLGDTVDGGISSSLRIDRCLGLYRDDLPLPEAAAFPAGVEKQWREEIDVLQAADAKDVQRCEYFFPKTSKARFCSDSCRFSTFQIMKQLQAPNYLADKQKRYRAKAKHPN